MTRAFYTLLVAGLSAACLAGAALSEEVTLRTADDSLILSGTLEEFDGTFYFLRTKVGLLRIDAGSVLCDGAACPELEPPLGFNVSGAAELTKGIFPKLVTQFASDTGAALKQTGSEAYSVTLAGDDKAADIALLANSSTTGIADLVQGRSSVALTTRAMTPEERAALETAGRGPVREHILAIEGLVIVTAPGNSLPSISIAQAGQIFSGAVDNWSSLGGPDAPIQLYTHAPDAAISEVFADRVLVPSGLALSKGAQPVADEAELARRVAADPNGIGFTRFASVGDARALPIIGVCGLVVTPNAFNIKTEEYPLTHRHHLYAVGETPPDVLEAMLTHLETGGADKIVKGAGMLGQDLTRGPVDQQGMRFASALKADNVVQSLPLLQQMVEEMVVSERLSATLRFETGSSTLDNRARKDIARIADLLTRETSDGARKVARIMGFTDSLGNPELNRELSLRRAQQVADALRDAAPQLEGHVELRPLGFGDVSPIGCDQTAQGRWTNRRVEIWLSNAPG